MAAGENNRKRNRILGENETVGESVAALACGEERLRLSLVSAEMTAKAENQSAIIISKKKKESEKAEKSK
jgi:hypothetical protein